MTRIVVGNRDGAVALAQARGIVADLASEWPELNLVQRTVQTGGTDAALFQALERGQVNLAVLGLERLPVSMPEGLVLASVTRRVEARSTLLAKGARSIAELAAGTHVGVPGARDEMFIEALAPTLTAGSLAGALDDSLKRLAEGEYGALVLPASVLMDLDRRNAIEQLLDPDVFPPTAGQGSLGLVVREDDDAAFELAYTLHHRPSFERVTAERSFVSALHGAGLAGVRVRDDVAAVGALATISGDGELELFGAVVAEGGASLQATSTGEVGEAADLGRELAQDFIQQLEKLAAR